MPARRSFLQLTARLMAGAAMSCRTDSAPRGRDESTQPWRMSDEGAPYQRTWMAFGASQRIWGPHLLPAVRRDLATLAIAIARYEPGSLLVRDRELEPARDLLSGASAIDLVVSPLDDLWIRATGPVFVCSESGERAAIDCNFNVWGKKQAYRQDAQVAARVARQAGVPLLATELVLEGGGIEVDGDRVASRRDDRRR